MWPLELKRGEENFFFPLQMATWGICNMICHIFLPFFLFISEMAVKSRVKGEGWAKSRAKGSGLIFPRFTQAKNIQTDTCKGKFNLLYCNEMTKCNLIYVCKYNLVKKKKKISQEWKETQFSFSRINLVLSNCERIEIWICHLPFAIHHSLKGGKSRSNE